MRTTLKIETSNKVFEVELKLVDGKQVVELELSDLLALIDGKGAKTSSAVRTVKAKPAAKAPKLANENPAVGAKRGRKPKSADETSAVSMGLES